MFLQGVRPVLYTREYESAAHQDLDSYFFVPNSQCGVCLYCISLQLASDLASSGAWDISTQQKHLDLSGLIPSLYA